MSLVPEKPRPPLGTALNPWDDLWFRDDSGASKSIRDIGGSGDQPFTVDNAGDVVLDPDRVINAGSGSPAPSSPAAGYMDKSYHGLDRPGTGDNTLSNGYSRIWMTMTGQVYLVTRFAYRYFLVELTEE